MMYIQNGLYSRVQCFGSSVASPQSSMLLQYLLTVTQRPFWQDNSDTLHFRVT